MRHGLLFLASAQIFGILIADGEGAAPQVAALAGLLCAVLYWLAPVGSALRLGLSLAIAVSAGTYGLGVSLERGARPVPGLPMDGPVEATICRGPAGVGSHLSVVLCSVRALPGPGMLPELSGHWLDTVWPDVLLSARANSPEAERLASLVAGQRIRAYLRFRDLAGPRNPGSGDFARALLRRGVGVQARLLEPGLLVRLPERDAWHVGSWRGNRVREELASWRRRVARGMLGAQEAVSLSPRMVDGGGLLLALATGDRTGLRAEVREAFSRLGLSHLLAVSGLHLAIVAGLAYRAALWLLGRATGARPARDRRSAALLLGFSSAGAYACLTGFGIPVLRAWIFLLVYFALGWSGRRVLGVQSLAAAAIVVLTLTPAALFELGARLSFVATAGLLAAACLRQSEAAGPSVPHWSGLWRLARQSLGASAVAVAVSAPLLAHSGMLVSPVGLLLNLVAIAWTALVLLPTALVSAGALIWAAGPAAPMIELARGLAGWSIHACLALADVWEFLPARVAVDLPVLAGVMGLAILCCRLAQPLSAMLVALSIVLWILGAPSPDSGPPPPRLVMFDVGQGDAILLQGRRGVVLVDGGRATDEPGIDLGRSAVGPALTALGVRRLDAVMASHADIDHRGGLRHILEQFDVAELWLPASLASHAGFASLRGLAMEKGILIRELAAGQPELTLGDLRFTTLWPPPSPIFESGNENSLVLRVQIGGRRVLLTGDIGFPSEQWLLDRGTDLRADILKVAHHGSRGSSSLEFLRAVDAGVALLSASCAGLSGLPSGHTLRRLERSGGQVWWTGQEGAVMVALSSEDMDFPRITGWGLHRPCPRGRAD